jgi:hypothetical protein
MGGTRAGPYTYELIVKAPQTGYLEVRMIVPESTAPMKGLPRRVSGKESVPEVVGGPFTLVAV